MKARRLVIIFGILPFQSSVALPGVGNYCGATYSSAAASCAVKCPAGVDSQCPSGSALTYLINIDFIFKVNLRPTLLYIYLIGSMHPEQIKANIKAHCRLWGRQILRSDMRGCSSNLLCKVPCRS